MNNNLQTRLIALASNENKLNCKLLIGGFFLIVSTFLTLITDRFKAGLQVEQEEHGAYRAVPGIIT